MSKWDKSKEGREWIKKWREVNKDKIKVISRRYYLKNKERINQRTRNYYKLDINNAQQKNRNYAKKYQKENKIRLNGYRKQYRENNKERLSKKIKEWIKKNPDKVRAYAKKYRIMNKHKYLIRRQTSKKYGKAKICFICSSTKNITHHHYTEPYEVDKFIDVCKEHHQLLNKIGTVITY